MFIEWVSFALVGATALAIIAGVGSTPGFRLIRNLLVAGACLRIAGVFARHWMIFDLYDGSSDAVGYFESGRIIAEYFRNLDFSIIGSGRWGDREWGTQFVRYASGLVLTIVGPSMRGTFLVFSFAAFAGLICMAVASGRANPARANATGSMHSAALLLFLWPTLWFWPSSIGKEALLLLAVGLVTLGYVGQNDRIRWMPMVSGLALAMAIRPHLAGVLAVSTCIAEWTSRAWTGRRLIQVAITSAITVWLLSASFKMLGLENADFAEMEGFLRQTADRTNQGGSAFDRANGTAAAIPMAFVNILCRPFITEVRSPMALVSSLEIMALWALAIRHSRTVGATLRSWRHNRLIRFAVPFAVLYILMIGITFQNLGIIVRQRTLVMPALLMVMASVPAMQGSRRIGVTRSRKIWRVSATEPAASSPFAPSRTLDPS
jgi:hypothetical protein